MNTGHIPPLRRTKPKPPSAQQQQTEAAQQFIAAALNRWEVLAVSKGSQDPSAQLQASRILLQLVQYLSEHKSTTKHGAVRVLLQRQLSAELLTGLLTSRHNEVVTTALQALQELACIVPAAVALEAAPPLVQLLCCRNHGPAAARTLRALLSHWRFSQLWPHWLAADATNQLFQQLQQLPVLAEAAQQVHSTAASRAVESCVSLLALLARLLSLAEQQVLQQLAPDVDTAGRWLELLVRSARQQAHVAGSPASLALQDSCCAILAGMSHAASTTAALLASQRLKQEVVQLLHGVWHRPCCVSEADSNHIQCWVHAATAASLPVLWQPPQDPQQHEQWQQKGGLLSAHEEQQLLADITVAAAATFCNECFVANSTVKRVDRAAASLLAAALQPYEAAYGSHTACTSRFMPAVLDSSCCHVLLHALAVSNTATPEQAALLAAAAASAAAAAASVGVASSSSGERSADLAPAGSASGAVALAPVLQEVQPEWLLLRMICAQCGAAAGNSDSAAPFSSAGSSPAASSSWSNGNSSHSSSNRGKNQHSREQIALLRSVSHGSGSSGSAVQPHQVLRVVQAYSSHVTTTSEAQRMPGLLRSLHFLMCQSVLSIGHKESQQQLLQPLDTPPPQQQQQQHWVPLMGTEASRSTSSIDSDGGRAHAPANGEQLLVTAAAVLDLINSAVAGHADAAAAAASVSTSPSAAAGRTTAPQPSPRSASQLSWALTASVYVALAITVYLQGRAPPMACLAPGAAPPTAACLSAGDSCLALAAVRLAAAALKLLLPVLQVQPRSNAAAAGFSSGAAKQKQQQQPLLAVPVHEPLVCSLAAVQALASLSALLQPALPELLWQCISSSSGYVGDRTPAATSCGSRGSNSGRAAGCAVTVVAATSAIAAAADALDEGLQQLLSEVVMAVRRTAPSSSSSFSQDSSSSRCSSQLPVLQTSVQASLSHSLQQELSCWAAAALVSCYGQLGTQSWQGALLAPCRDPGAPFADVSLQLGHGGAVPAHAAVLAAGCPVLRQQLLHAMAHSVTAAATANGSSAGSRQPAVNGSAASRGPLSLKLSAAVDPQALQQALDFTYTGAALLPHTALASALQLCSSCLSSPAAGHKANGPAPRQHRQLQQRQQLQQLQDMQQTARQQLHRLGMLARKLQLPLLAALTRCSRPQPGHCLPGMPVNLAALLPQQVFLSSSSCYRLAAADQGGYSTAGPSANGAGQAQQQLRQGQQDSFFEDVQPSSSPSFHPSTEQYLSILAACAAHEGFNDQHSSIAVTVPGHAGVRGCGVTDQAFADAFMVAPAVVATAAATPAPTSNAAIAMCGPLSSQRNPEQQRQQQQQVVYAYLPTHKVILSACCPYFEALLSERWQHGSTEQQLQLDEQVADAAALGPQQQQQQEQQQRRCSPAPNAPAVLVPEADIHVAAALQHFLYSGSLQVQLPPGVLFQPTTVPSVDAAAQTEVPAAATAAAAAPEVLLNGCCTACHQARTLLRLWRCAELLLLPGLQASCLAAVEAAGWQLDICCCLLLLADCCHLGVPAAADGLLEALSHRADPGTATTLPEWSGLPGGLQGVLTKAWADRKMRQDAEDQDMQGLGAPGLVAAVPAVAAGSLAGGPGPAATQLAHCTAALHNVGLSAEPVHSGRAAPSTAAHASGLVCLQQQQQGLQSSQAVVLPLKHVALLEAAGRSMGAAVTAALSAVPQQPLA